MIQVDEIKTEMSFKHPPQKVWSAVTTSQGLSGWFSDRVTIDLVEGGEIVLDWDEYGIINGTVERVEPITIFAFRWRAHGVPEDVAMDSTNSTLITFEIEAQANGSHLTVVETGFAGLRPELREVSYRENVSGWKAELAELIEYIEGSPAV